MRDQLTRIIKDIPDSSELIVVLGPTAGGKSELAVAIAEQINGEIISADSMQIYRHMDAGTAKPPRQLKQRAVHHMIDVVEPAQKFTVANWLGGAESIIADLKEQGKKAVVVGGTNLYVKALLEGLFDGPGEDKAFRLSLENISNEKLHQMLEKVDSAAARRIAVNDIRRTVRALEVFHLTGTPLSDLQRQWDEKRAQPYRYNPFLIGLSWPVELINGRINKRVKAMFYPDKVDRDLAEQICPNDESLPEETKHLEQAGLLGTQAREALGYKQVLAHLNGSCSLEDAFENTKIQTRRYARQQRTWLKRFKGVNWIEGK